ncbi:T9SS C-terminal target domain-containing protein [Fibrisoma montanum]|uniref:T9SS C-terminal target domain-containing protein n=2 Tax=Fibrisoma montanum TaxID=2305895 RepID=A0A418ME85_9BACT|nr:T9SS C-terminal target domain-containing protein [Fibrisoma montanum]
MPDPFTPHMRFLIFTLLLIQIGSLSFAQQLSISSVGRACRNQPIRLDLETKNEFAADNQFTAQVSTDGANWQSLSSRFVAAATLETTLPGSLPAERKAYLRVLTTNPMLTSNTVEVDVLSLPTAGLISAKTEGLQQSPLYPNGISTDSLQVNPLSALRFQLQLSGGSPYRVTLNDSSTHTMSDFSNEIMRLAEKSFTYQVSQVSNQCGIGNVSPKTLSAAVNPIAIHILQFGTTNVCAGKPFSIKLVTEKPLPATITLYAILTPTMGSTGQSYRASVSPTSSVGIFDITAPGTIKPGQYHVSIRSDSPKLRADIPGTDFVQVTRTNTFSISNPVQTIPFGSRAMLSGTYDALYARMVFEDGYIAENDPYTSAGVISRVVYPTQRTVYTIRAVQSAICGFATIDRPVSYTVNVRPGIILDSLNSYEACTGASVTAYYHANFLIASGSTIPLLLGTTSITATILDGQRLRFQIPPSIKPGAYSLAAVTDGLADRSSTFSLTIKAPPVARLKISEPYSTQLASYTYDRPGVRVLALETGTTSSQFVATLSDGQSVRLRTRADADEFVYVYADKASTVYNLTSVRNECGLGSIAGGVELRVRQPTASVLALQLPTFYPQTTTADYCPGDSIQVSIRVTNLADTPSYRIEYSAQEGVWSDTYLTGSVRPGQLGLKLPAQSGIYWLRARSVATGQTSSPVRVAITGRTVVNLSYSENSFSDQPITLVVRFSESRPPFSFRLSNGLERTSDTYETNVFVSNQTPASYSLVSASGGCNVPVVLQNSPVMIPKKVTQADVKPEILSAGDLSSRSQRHIRCEGAILRLPYLQRGNFPAAARLEARLIGPGRKFLHKLTVLDPVSPATIRVDSVPNPTGQYSVQLVVMLGDSVLSATSDVEYSIFINKVGSVRLTGGIDGKLQIDRNSDASNGTVALTEGARPALIWLNNGTALTSYNQSEGTVNVPFYQAGVFTVRQAVSACGYMPVEGRVEVSFQPAIKQFSLDNNPLCRNRTMRLNYKTVGEFAADNAFTFVFRSFPYGDAYVLAKTKQLQGPITFTLPTTMPTLVSGSITMISSNPAFQYDIDNVSIAQLPQAQLLPSTTTIYPGQSAYIPIVVTGDGSERSVQFTNGQLIKGFFETGTVEVKPTQTTTYRLNMVSNQCGNGTVSGEATVVVIPRTNPSIDIDYTSNFNTLCAAKESIVSFKPTGSFNADNVFALQLSDSTGQNYQTVVSNPPGARSEFRFTLPANQPTGRTYRMRVTSSSPAVVGSSTAYPIAISPPVTALISSTDQKLNKGDSATIVINFTGIPPFRYALASAYYSVVDGFGAPSTTHVIRPQVDTSQQYCLLDVYTPTCGYGTIVPGKAKMTVEVFGQSYDETVLEAIVFPNPTSDNIRVSVFACEADTLSLTLTNINGQYILQQETPIKNGGTRIIPMASYPAGVYILRAQAGNRQRTFRIIRQ